MMVEKENVVPAANDLALRHLNLGKDQETKKHQAFMGTQGQGLASSAKGGGASALLSTPVAAARASAPARTPLGSIGAAAARTPLSSLRHQQARDRDLGSLATPSSSSRVLRERLLQQGAAPRSGQTPRRTQHQAPPGASGASRKNTWNGDVDIYADTVLPSKHGKQASQAFLERVRRVKEDPACADHWWNLLASEEDGGHEPQGLYKLYEWATKLVPRKGNKNSESYVGLWLGYIKRQRNEEDIRDTFKTLRNMGIGETSPSLYQQWALFEVAAGNAEKARGIVRKGVKAGAMDKGEAEALLARLDSHNPAAAAPAQEQKLGGLARQQVTVAKREEEETQNRTDPSVLSSRTFCSSVYSNSSTLHATGTPFRGVEQQQLTSASSAPKSTGLYTPTAGAKPGQARTAAGTPARPDDSATPVSLKGPKRLGLKRFAGPARRIKPAEDAAPPQQERVATAEGERRALAPLNPAPAAPTTTENYTDLSGKLSPIVEVSYSTQSSTRTSTRTASSCQSEGTASRKASPEAEVAEPRQEAAAQAPQQPAVRQQQVAPQVAPSQRPESKPSTSGQQVRESSNSVTVHNVKYTVLECVGKGGSSKVYKVISPEHKIFALKRIKLEGREKEAAAGFMDEITLLNRFKGRHHIIQLVDSQIFREAGIIYMVLEYGEVDLARLLQRREKVRSAEGQGDKIDLNFIRLHWQQMLEAVHIIHEERIVHSDLKPANFLFVEGVLKLIDFGIAKAIQNDTTHIARESQVGTLNYMSPEAILSGSNGNRSGKQTKVGRASDVWSLGCILYQMVYGHTPFSHLQFIQKLHAITDPNHEIDFPTIQNQSLLDVMRRCLDRNPKTRIGIPDLLDHVFLNPSQEAVAPTNLLTPEFLNSMLTQLSNMGQSSADISKLSQELCKQLASGNVPDLKSLIPAAGSGPPAPGPPTAPPPPPPPPMPAQLAPKNKMELIMKDIKKKRELRSASGAAEPSGRPQPRGGPLQHGGDIAAAAAAKALARSKERQEAVIALERRDPSASDELRDALQKQHAALKPVVPVEEQKQSCDGASGEDLAGVFRSELSRKFQGVLSNNNDTVTMTGEMTGGSVTEDTMEMSWS